MFNVDPSNIPSDFQGIFCDAHYRIMPDPNALAPWLLREHVAIMLGQPSGYTWLNDPINHIKEYICLT